MDRTRTGAAATASSESEKLSRQSLDEKGSTAIDMVVTL